MTPRWVKGSGPAASPHLATKCSSPVPLSRTWGHLAPDPTQVPQVRRLSSGTGGCGDSADTRASSPGRGREQGTDADRANVNGEEDVIYRKEFAAPEADGAADTIFRLIDVDGDGWVSKSDFSAALAQYGLRARPPPARSTLSRGERRVLIIEPGFGRDSRQGLLVDRAGFQIHWCCNLPLPEQGSLQVAPYLPQIFTEIQQFQPEIVACASAGGAYVVGLWQAGYWTGPTLMINVHPSCRRLPEGMAVVLAHGSNDEAYQLSRRDLEAVAATGSPNQCFLYMTTNSGQVSPGVFTREGDRHKMKSLLLRGCLPRLLDGLLCPEGPEVHMLRTWQERLSDRRIEAESWLGNMPQELKRHWESFGRRGRGGEVLFEVRPDSEEFVRVATVFKEMPREKPAYLLYSTEEWDRVSVVRVERVENGPQEEGGTRPFCKALLNSFAGQGVRFEPGVHTCWGFHGADSEALQSIACDPVVGFQPLTSGMRNCAVWGGGTYFARDAQYVAGSHFCGPPASDGTRQMLMCLMLTGMPCLGDPEHRGVLPYRQKPHRYNSSVDSLSSPEVFVVQHPSAAYPAYLITFA